MNAENNYISRYMYTLTIIGTLVEHPMHSAEVKRNSRFRLIIVKTMNKASLNIAGMEGIQGWKRFG